MLFVTTSMGTKWEPYSQALLKISFSDTKRIIVNGRKNWNPLSFVDVSLLSQYDYIIHVDEDCFVLNGDDISRWVALMEENEKLAIVGTPDGGTFHRDFNPIACNLFFLIIKCSSLEKIFKKPNWMKSRYRRQYKQRDNVLSDLDKNRISWSKEEPYYPLFWSLLEAGYGFHYIVPSLDEELLATEIRGRDNNVSLIHMWWLRNWNNKNIEPYLGISHCERYARLEKYLDENCFSSKENRRILNEEKIRAQLRKLFR